MDNTYIISQELDTLSCDLIETAFDALADGIDISVLVSVQDSAGTVTTHTFKDDAIDVCLNEARAYIVSKKNTIVRYCLVYVCGVALEEAFLDALVIEYGERGMSVAYSGYSLIQNVGQGELFMWCDLEPAGELDLLI